MYFAGRLEKREAVFLAFDDFLFAQFADLCGQTAAVDFQIVRQLLPVVGDRELAAAVDFGLVLKIRHQLLPGASPGSDLDLLVENQIFVRYETKQIIDNPAVEGAGTGAGGGDPPAVH